MRKPPKYKSRISRSSVIPFGYYADAQDKQLLLPNEKELDALEEGKRLIKKGCSYRDVAEWLTNETGRYISHMGLYKRVYADRRRQKQAQIRTNFGWDQLDDDSEPETETKSKTNKKGKRKNPRRSKELSEKAL